jgi:hypothetical protein
VVHDVVGEGNVFFVADSAGHLGHMQVVAISTFVGHAGINFRFEKDADLT